MGLRRRLLRADSWPSRSDSRLNSSESRVRAIGINFRAVDRSPEAKFFNSLMRYANAWLQESATSEGTEARHLSANLATTLGLLLTLADS